MLAWIVGCVVTNVIALFPCSSSTKSETDESRPCAALEEEDGENDAEAETKAGADDHGGEAAIPLEFMVSHLFLTCEL